MYSRYKLEHEIKQDNKRLLSSISPGGEDKKKVVHYIGQLGPGGAERQLSNLVIYLRDHGIDSSVLTISLEGTDGHYYAYLHDHKVPVKVVQPCPLDDLRKKLPDNPQLNFTMLELIPDFLQWHILGLVNELLSLKPDVLHCWLDYSNIIGGFAGLIAGIPRIVLSGRNLNPTHFPTMNTFGFVELYKILLKSNRIVLTNNSKVGAKDYAEWLTLPPGRITVIHNGIDFTQLDPVEEQSRKNIRDSFGIDKEAPLVVGILRLSPEKRPFDFIDVIEKVKEEIHTLKVLLIGTGILTDEVRAYINQKNLEETIILLSRRNDVYSLIKASDIVLHTAEIEGTPNVLMEAQYLRVPIVAANAGGTREVLSHKMSGLVPVGDIKGLTSNVVKLLLDRKKAKKLGKAGHDFIKKRFPVGEMADKYLKVYFKTNLTTKIRKLTSNFQKYGFLATTKTICQHVKRFPVVKAVLFLILSFLYPMKVIRRFGHFIKALPSVLWDKGTRVAVRLHPLILGFICVHADRIRTWRKPAQISDKSLKKVIHVTCSFDLGGTQRQIMNLCENSEGGKFVHDTTEVFPEVNYLYRKNVQLESNRYIRGSWLSRLVGRWTLNASYRSLQVIQIYKLWRDFEYLRPDIVVGWGHEVAMLTFVAASIARVPRIVFCIRTFNPSFGWTTIGPLLFKAHKKMIPHLDEIIVNSTPLRKDYAAWQGIPEESIRVCSNGIEPHPLSDEERSAHRREIRARFDIPDEAVVVAHMGRFSEEKGQLILAKALKKVIEQHPEKAIYCILCGDGPTQKYVQNFVEFHGMPTILFAGRVDNIYAYLCAADIFVMPSDFEGMPNAMMEAMSYGLPSVSTNRTGALDVAREGQEALYVEVGSVKQLADKLSYLVERPDERRRLGDNARERLKEFSVTKMIDCFNNHLRDCI